jgi:hypothetical protein
MKALGQGFLAGTIIALGIGGFVFVNVFAPHINEAIANAISNLLTKKR